MDPLRPGSRAPETSLMRGTAYRRRIGGVMLIAGGLLAFATLLISGTEADALVAMVVPGCVAIGLGAALILRPRFAPEWATPFFVALGTLLITLSTRTAGVGGAEAADNEVLYLMVVLYSFYFLSTSQAFLQLAIVGIAYGAILLEELPLATSAPRWLVTLGTLTVAGLLVRSLNQRVEGLIADLDSNARHDSLTGALNRRGLDERLGIELARARRTGDPLTVITADIDEFKVLNDEQGHLAGDEALQLAAVVMSEALRDADVLARVGGDEFVMLLPACEPLTGAAIAEKLRIALSTRSAAESWPVTMSLGVAGSPPLPLDPDALVNAADRALYRAKASGRDRACLAGDAELRRFVRLD